MRKKPERRKVWVLFVSSFFFSFFVMLLLAISYTHCTLTHTHTHTRSFIKHFAFAFAFLSKIRWPVELNIRLRGVNYTRRACSYIARLWVGTLVWLMRFVDVLFLFFSFFFFSPWDASILIRLLFKELNFNRIKKWISRYTKAIQRQVREMTFWKMSGTRRPIFTASRLPVNSFTQRTNTHVHLGLCIPSRDHLLFLSRCPPFLFCFSWLKMTTIL